LLGLATALKLQIGAPFLLYYALVRHWRVCLTGVGVFAAIALVGIVPLEMRGVPWLREWRTTIMGMLEPGHGNDPRPGGPFRNDMVNVQALLYCVTSNDWAVRTLVVLLFVPLF